MRIDLHTHTTASDGQYTPPQLVALAQARGFDVIGITDHDTTDGIAEAQRAAAGLITIVPGIEFSAEDDQDVHMLGYFIDIADAEFQAQIREFRDDRYHRGQKILAKLDSLGVKLDWARVTEIAAGGSIGRPHIARAMVEAGYVESTREAFERYIANGGPAYVARRRMTPEEAIALIHSAGGAAVLAHPNLLRDYRAMVERLIPAGLDGVEVAHPSNDSTARDNLRGLARQYNLVMTGGSDFHGPAVKPDIALGCETPPPGALEGLRERAARYAKTTPTPPPNI